MAKFLLAIFVLCLFFSAKGQTSSPPLERIVSIDANHQTIADILIKLSVQGKFSFSYSSKYIQAEEKITLNVKSKSVRYTLDRMFKGSVTYKSKGNYIILTAAPKKTESITKAPEFTIVSGYIFEKESSSQLPQVSIFDENTLYASVTDHYGYFTMRIPNSSTRIQLNVQKNGYVDTTVTIDKTYFEAVEIVLRKKKDQPRLPYLPHQRDTSIRKIDSTTIAVKEPGTLSRIKEMSFLLTQKMKSSITNISDTLFKHAQFSLVPGLSTNGLVGTNIINRYSFNLLAGYSYGVKYVEIGGLFNAHRGNVSYFEAAGLLNVVGGNVTGFQGAGLGNICKNNVKGMQAAGLFNTSQFTHGVQAAGLFNTSKIVDGAQLGGLFNYAKTVDGIQIGGLFNYSKQIKGAQISGLVNITRNLQKGVMISLVNIADSCSGVPIGLISYVKHGYHKIELSADEIFYANLSFRTGVKKFHTMFTAGIVPKDMNKTLWTYGYGLGTTFTLHPKLNLDIDLSTHQIHRTQALPKFDSLQIETLNPNSLNLNNKLYVGIEWQLAKKVSLAAGPTLNIHVMDTSKLNYFETFARAPGYFYDKGFNTSYQCRMWVGGKIGLRFF